MGIGDVLFMPWPSWAKLSFVLGGLLVVVMCFATVMKIRNWRRTVKLERLAAEEQAERGEIMDTARISEDIPFGIKALEEEPAIDGVWNARTATPLHTPPGSRGSSPRLGPSRKWQKAERGSSASSVSRLDIEDQAQAATQPAPSFAPNQAPPDQPLLPTARRKKANSITISYSGPSTTPKDDPKCVLCDTDPIEFPTPSDSEVARPKLRLQTPPKRAGSLRRRFVIGGRQSPEQAPSGLQKENQTAIERMNAHRKLHSAESGQLLPRPRRHTTEIPGFGEERSIVDGSSSPVRTLSWPARENSVRLSQKLPRKPEKRKSPPAMPQRASIEVQPASKTCPSAWTNRTQELMYERLAATRPSQTDPSLPSLYSSTTVSSITQTSDVISIPSTQSRKANDGFELLPAGTLEKEPEFKILGLWPATIVDNPSARKKPNKLQKRPRSGSATTTSSRCSRKSEDCKSEDFTLRHTVY